MNNEIVLPHHECLRCHHTWVPRQPIRPLTCPSCRSPYWNMPRWKGDEEMVQEIFVQLYRILERLAADCEQTITTKKVVLELAREGSKYHFKIPNPSRKQVIAWSNLRVSRSPKFNKDEPCVIVGVDASLLNDKDSVYIKHYQVNANYGRRIGLVQVAVSDTDSQEYKLVLKALIEAANNIFTGKRYQW